MAPLGIELALLLAAATATAAEPSPGIVFIVGGVGGLDPVQYAAVPSLRRAGVPHEVCIFEWTHGKCRILRDLQDRCHILAQGARLADEVRDFQQRCPGRPVYLVGHSAGACVVLAAAELLPPASLERIILLSAAVSPTYHLAGALRATRCELVSFHCPGDYLVLGLGTQMFGTADRHNCSAAGRRHKAMPADLEDEERCLYERLVQVPCGLGMFLEGCGVGPHHCTCMPLFLSHRVAPWLGP
jgi:pimeloyl-ACP methyl ester carboxylesterase